MSKKSSQTPAPIRKAAVLGAGVMGAQIAAHLANAGVSVELLDIPSPKGPRDAVINYAFKMLQKAKPPAFMHKAAVSRIRLGNLEDHLERIADCDWVIEAVVENLDIKKALHKRVDALRKADTLVTTNTSGLLLSEISDGLSDSFRAHFFGTHFFNPPRYMKLLEFIATPQTRPDALERLLHFTRLHLGKGAVMAKDTPNFIANRIGNFAMMQAIYAYTRDGFTIPEVDTLTGPLIGNPRSANFRTLDVVGIDTALKVAENLYAAIPDDESREQHKAPKLMHELVERGHLGQKAGKGFYKKAGREIRVLNPETFEYDAAPAVSFQELAEISKVRPAAARLAALFDGEGKACDFFRRMHMELLSYCARRVPEITDNPADIDTAMRWGYAWQFGPFERWDAIGFEKMTGAMRADGIELPSWIDDMRAAGATSFYRDEDGVRSAWVPGKGYTALEAPADEINLNVITSQNENLLWENPEVALHDLGEQVGLLEFRSKANALGQHVVNGILGAIDHVESHDLRGMVIGNTGKNFSVGANLAEVITLLDAGRLADAEKYIARFQDMIKRIRYAAKPVVSAVQGMALGGGCEIVLASRSAAVSAESYIGLVELGAGVIPAGGGLVHFATRAAEMAASEEPSHVMPFLEQAFRTIAMAKVSNSGLEAAELGLLPDSRTIVMHTDRRLHVAREEVIRLSEMGYLPPPARNRILVLGEAARANFEVAGYNLAQAGYASQYDRYLAGKLAYVLSGGGLSGPAHVHEDFLFELEREAFMELLGQEKTRDRIRHILKTNKPLRN